MNRKEHEQAKEQEQAHRSRSCLSKQKYNSESEAIYAGQARNFCNRTEVTLSAYECKYCGGFHLTSN